MVLLENNPESEKELFKILIPKNAKKGIEIGVLNGETSCFFLNEFPDLFLVGIDPFVPDSMEPSLIGSRESVFKNILGNESRFLLLENFSYQIANDIDTSNDLDFIFIDGSHIYDDVKLDYELYQNKVKKGGLIFFHDSRMYRGGAPFHPGSSKFVDELIASNAHKLVGEAFSLTCFQK